MLHVVAALASFAIKIMHPAVQECPQMTLKVLQAATLCSATCMRENVNVVAHQAPPLINAAC